jgi:hypothetical protein
MWAYHTPKLVSKNTFPEKEVDTPTKKQSSATHCCKKNYNQRMKQQWKKNKPGWRSCTLVE